MEKFTTITAIGAPLDQANIDTDAIIPKQFLKTLSRTGLGKSLFFEMRYDETGKENPLFVLNRPPWRKAQILIAGENFGTGSSREHAAWALKDFGFRVIIAPYFADIFYNNCLKNAILPVALPAEQVRVLMEYAQSGDNARLTVDLVNQRVGVSGEEFAFSIDAQQRHNLLEGIDDIAQTMKHSAAIARFEQARQAHSPWLAGAPKS